MKPENVLIAIDDGHGTDTAGKRTPVFEDGTLMKENEFNWAVAKKLNERLQKRGFKTLLVAPEETDTPLSTRVKRANEGKATLYLSIHANANTGVWGEWGGIETFVHPKSSEGRRVGKIIHESVLKGTKLRDRGVKDGSHLYVIKNTSMPAVLVELGFMDNPYEASLLRSDAYREECATELYEGICQAYGVEPYPAPARSTPIPSEGKTQTKKTKFSDVPAGHWAEEYIQIASEAGIMVGYPDGTFGPGKTVTRAEMAVIVAKLLQRG